MNPQRNEAIFAERSVKVICIGAGASGILLAYKLKKHLDSFSLTIYEKNSDISGTWHENRYPGCACDVPAHNYTYSFEPKHDWSAVYASSVEIKGYFKHFCSKHDLENYIKTSHRVEHAAWDDATGQWIIDVENGATGKRITDSCDILIYAGGYLNDWAWPKVPRRDQFEGTLLHSANWVDAAQIEGKTVALIGSGSSAIQILPKVQETAKNVTTFVRSPLWILPTISSDPRPYSTEEIDDFSRNPRKHLTLRKYNENVVNSIYSLYLAGSELQEKSKRDLEAAMRQILNDKKLEDALVPSWGVGCRRLAPDTGYLKAVKQENVRLVKGGVVSFVAEGCIDEHGETHPADVIICATGFDTSYVPRFPIIGKDGCSIQDIMSKSPTSYYGIGVSGFPNFLTFLGPYSPVANGPTLAAIEAQADYIVRMIDRFRTEPIHSFHPSQSAQSDFTSHVTDFMSKTVYTDNCRSGHKNHTIDGRTPTVWPGSTLHYLQAMQDIRGEDWDISYERNRFAFLGNGISHAEFEPTCDLAYYVRNKDDGPPLTRKGIMQNVMRVGSQPPRALHTTYRPDIINLPPDEIVHEKITQAEKEESTLQGKSDEQRSAKSALGRLWLRLRSALFNHR